MIMICQIFVLALIMGIVWYLGYRKGRNIREREYAEIEEPALTPNEEERMRKYYEFCKLYDQLMTDDDFFTGDIAKSSRTDTNKDEIVK